MENKYIDSLLQSASKCDSILGKNWNMAGLAKEIVEGKDASSTVRLFRKISEAISDGNPRTIKAIQELKDSLILYHGYMKIREICNMDAAPVDLEDSKSLPELLDDLNGLVGLDIVKKQVNDLIAYQKVVKLRRENGLFEEKNTLHLAFTGNPGTGKTTVARIVGRIYKQIGLLSKGHFIEASRTDLIAGYQGQTALKVKDIIERAKGGVLFIDEAYSITENDHSDSYGRECLTELTKALEDYRDDLVVIVAGYTEPMQHFFESNPGLKSRFNTIIEFDDYNEAELEKMLLMMCAKNDYKLADEAFNHIKEKLSNAVQNKDDKFANGRLVRNLYEKIVMNHARRVAAIETPTIEQLMEIMLEDVIDI